MGPLSISESRSVLFDLSKVYDDWSGSSEYLNDHRKGLCNGIDTADRSNETSKWTDENFDHFARCELLLQISTPRQRHRREWRSVVAVRVGEVAMVARVDLTWYSAAVYF